VCSFSASRSRNVCCKEGNKSCNSDKECCRGRCLYKEDSYGNLLVHQVKVCTEDQTCAAQNQKTTKEYCERESDCCGSEQVLLSIVSLRKVCFRRGTTPARTTIAADLSTPNVKMTKAVVVEHAKITVVQRSLAFQFHNRADQTLKKHHVVM